MIVCVWFSFPLLKVTLTGFMHVIVYGIVYSFSFLYRILLHEYITVHP